MTGVMWRSSLFSRAVVFSFVALSFLIASGIRETRAQAFSEGFDLVNSNEEEPLPGWFAQNNSEPAGSTMWFQGNSIDVFPSHQGGPDAYIAANFNSTGNLGNISTWLLTPQKTFNDGDVLTFWTRTVTPGANRYPDRLEVRLSTAGASTNVGLAYTEVGDFTTRLLVINEGLAQGGYPEVWTEYTILLSGLPGGTASGRLAFRYFVPDGGLSGTNSNYIGIDTFSLSSGTLTPADHQECDFDGDGRTDKVVVRNTGGGANGQVTWFGHRSSDGTFFGAAWGLATDTFAPADYDGDNLADVAVFRQNTGMWYILNSATGTVSEVRFGEPGDDIVTGDWDGDGHAEPAVYRSGANVGEQSYFFYLGSLNNPNGNITYIPWGQNGDFGASGDLDGDGRDDAIVQRNDGGGRARFFVYFANGTIQTFVFGVPTDTIVMGDYNGDSLDDVAVLRSEAGQIVWYVRDSATGGGSGAPFAIFGASATDFSAQGDYDGDGSTDVAVWRPNADPTQCFFYWQGSTSGLDWFEWGQNGDYPVANWNRH